MEQVANVELLSSLTGPKTAEALLLLFGGLTALARAPKEKLGQLQGVGPSTAAAIRSALLLTQRLSRDDVPATTTFLEPRSGPLTGRCTEPLTAQGYTH